MKTSHTSSNPFLLKSPVNQQILTRGSSWELQWHVLGSQDLPPIHEDCPLQHGGKTNTPNTGPPDGTKVLKKSEDEPRETARNWEDNLFGLKSSESI